MIDFFIIEKYINFCNLEGLQKHGNKFNAKCPVCYDSKVSKKKKRFWILTDDKKATAYCFNCNYSASFKTFLRTHFPTLYENYKNEILKDVLNRKSNVLEIQKSKKQEVMEKGIQQDKKILGKFQKVWDIPQAKEYCLKRKLKESFIKELFYTENYMKFLSDEKINDFKYIPEKDERIVIPLYTKEKDIIGFQGRAIYDTDLRYITTKFNDNIKVWGEDRIDETKPIYLLEGIFDASFVENSLAICGGSMEFDYFKKYDKMIFIPDNDIYKNKTIKMNAIDAVLKNFGLVLFPIKFSKYKDINEFIKNGYSIEDMKQLIEEYTFFGIEAQVRLIMIRV